MPASAASCKKEARIDLPFLSILSFFPSSSLSHLLIICQPKEGRRRAKVGFRRIRSIRRPLEMQYSSVLPRSRSVLPVSESLILAGRCRRRRYTSIRKGLELAGLPAWHQRMHASTQTLARISCEEAERMEGGGRIVCICPSPFSLCFSTLSAQL